MRRILILGGGGFIGGHLANKMKKNENFVRVADIKNNEYFEHSDICDEFLQGDLRDLTFTKKVFDGEPFDEVYQLAADMGGAGYIFSGENDANVMHNSALININVVNEATLNKSKKVFYSSSACIYPEHNQMDPENPNCEESSAYPANPDSEYGWEKLFSERLYLAFQRNYGLDVRIARFHNIFGTKGSYNNGKEKAPAALCRKVAEAEEGGEIEIWGDGKQTRTFLYIDECLEAIEKFMESDFIGPVNIGSEEMISINELAEMVIGISGKTLTIKNLYGNEFVEKYGFRCPLGVRGRKSNNDLYQKEMNWKVEQPLSIGIRKTYEWIESQIHK